MTAKSYGLNQEAESILAESGITEDKLNLPKLGEALAPHKPVVPTYKANWPTKATSQSFFEKALLEQAEEEVSVEDETVAAADDASA